MRYAQHYNHVASETQTKQLQERQQWVESQTPETIKKANLARKRLRRLGFSTRKYPNIEDARQPKAPVVARIAFSTERYRSGDMNGIKLGDASKLLTREWNELNAVSKKVHISFSHPTL